MSVEVMDFEKEAIRILGRGHIKPEILDEVLSKPAKVEIGYTGWGYHLTISHDLLPKARLTCHEPVVVGKSTNDLVGFVVFIGGHEIFVDVHALQRYAIGSDFRLSAVKIS